MFWTIRVESNLGEVFCAQDQFGNLAGEALVDFYNPLDLYCHQQSNELEKAWFDKLNNEMNGKLCQYIEPFLKSVYAGDWNYEEEEFAIFKLRDPSLAEKIGEEGFRHTVRQIKNKWTEIREITMGIEELIRSLEHIQAESTYWYEPSVTVGEFKALISTLEIHSERGADIVRIKIK